MSGGAAGSGVGAESELHRRLAEAEDTLRAIREGEVDALVMRGEQADEVFALGGQDSYRAFMEAMDIGAAALDAEGRVIYANAALAGLLGRSAAELARAGLDAGFWAALDARTAALVRRLVGDAAQGRCSGPATLDGGDRGPLYLEVTAAPLPLGFGQGCALTFVDVTERIEAATAHESDRIGRAIMASSNEAVVVTDREGRITHANAAVRHFREGPVAGRTFDEAFPLGFALGSGLLGGSDLVDVALAGSTVRGVEASLPRGGRNLDLCLNAAPLRQAGEVVGGAIISLADVSESKATQKRQALLIGELNHRVKNTLTLVMAIANRTMASARDMGDFRAAFAQRLEALAATHNLLAEDSWTGLTLEDLVYAEFAPYLPATSERLEIDGLAVRVAPNTAVTLGLIVHELVTNAVKYGALSNESGRVRLAATRDEAGLTLEWSERDGPPVTPPERRGFGQTVIERGLGQTGERATRIAYDPEGVSCRMFVAREFCE